MSRPLGATKILLEASLTDAERASSQPNTPSDKRKYEKPELIVHGTVGELTQSGGNRHHDGIVTRKLS